MQHTRPRYGGFSEQAELCFRRHHEIHLCSVQQHLFFPQGRNLPSSRTLLSRIRQGLQQLVDCRQRLPEARIYRGGADLWSSRWRRADSYLGRRRRHFRRFTFSDAVIPERPFEESKNILGKCGNSCCKLGVQSSLRCLIGWFNAFSLL